VSTPASAIEADVVTEIETALADPAKRARLISAIQSYVKEKPVWARRLTGILLIIAGGYLAVAGPFDGANQLIGGALALAGGTDLAT